VAEYEQLIARLDPQQREVASWTPQDGNLRVLANAGSGKTTTLVALTANLVLGGHVDPGELVVTTFTKKAGEELRTRLGKVLPPHTLNGMRVGTFHAIGLQALRAINPDKWNISRCIEIQSGRAPGVPSSNELWRAICAFGQIPGLNRPSLQLSDEPKYYKKQIDLWRAQGAETYGEASVPLSDDPQRKRFFRECEAAWDTYTAAKDALNVWDFNDILAEWLVAVRNAPPQRAVVLIDEAQDNNIVQLDIGRELTRDGGRLCLIGDVKQSIYKFRGAYPDLFRSAERELGAQSKQISTNYRSLPHIVAFANDFIANKPWSGSTPSIAARASEGGFVGTLQGGEPHDEADAVGERIAEALIGNTATPGDFAILCRTNAARMAFESALISRNIPVVVLGSRSAFDNKEAKVVLAYCTLSARDDVDALDTILNVPKRFLPRAMISDVHTHMAGGKNLLSALTAAKNGPRVKPASRRNAEGLVRQLHALRDAAWEDVPDMVGQILRPWLEKDEDDESRDDEDNAALVATTLHLAGLFPNAAQFIDFAQRCATRTQSRAEGEAPGNAVTISTIHKVKGLEWPHVFVSAPADLLPHAKSTDTDEEERLYYVAITRARDTLTVTANEADGGLTPFFPMNE
jgi:DNA helicase-2/ATP-dependent DNA helicase PcrA